MKQFHSHEMEQPVCFTATHRPTAVDEPMDCPFNDYVDEDGRIDAADNQSDNAMSSRIEVVEHTFENTHLDEYLLLVKSNGYYPAVCRLVC
jgi:hypothetical protein